jgi:hypothetical protein
MRSPFPNQHSGAAQEGARGCCQPQVRCCNTKPGIFPQLPVMHVKIFLKAASHMETVFSEVFPSLH